MRIMVSTFLVYSTKHPADHGSYQVVLELIIYTL